MTNHSKPTLRDIERVDLQGSLINLVKRIITEQYPYRNCLNCIYFTEVSEQCKVWNAKPPARVICYGCDKHTDIEEIPF